MYAGGFDQRQTMRQVSCQCTHVVTYRSSVWPKSVAEAFALHPALARLQLGGHCADSDLGYMTTGGRSAISPKTKQRGAEHHLKAGCPADGGGPKDDAPRTCAIREVAGAGWLLAPSYVGMGPERHKK